MPLGRELIIVRKICKKRAPPVSATPVFAGIADFTGNTVDFGQKTILVYLTFFGFDRGTACGTFYYFPQFISKNLHFFAASSAFNLDLTQGLVGFKSWTMLFLLWHNFLLHVFFG